MEEFFAVLTARGVRIETSEQAAALGSAVADIARAFGMVEEDPTTVIEQDDVTETLATVAVGLSQSATLSPPHRH